MRKLLALVLSVTMIFCAIPVFAQEGSQVTEPEKTDISKAVVVLSDNAESQVYTGEAIVLADDQITVTLGGGTDAVTLKNGTDYEVKYSNNVNAGTAEISIIGKGIYGGEVKAEFAITAKQFTASDYPEVIIPTQNKGEEKMENVVVSWKGKTLVEGTDYTVTGDNSKAGTSEATITFKGNFEGTLIYQYNVVSNDIADAALYFNDLNAKYIYSGTAKTPGITLVADGNKTLVEGTDYYITYLNNINAGEATIRVVGMGMYAGTVEKNFTIGKAALSDTEVVFEQDAYAATGSAIEAKFKVTLNGITIDEKQYTAEYKNNVNIGKASVVLTAAANSNFTGTKTADFTIAAKAAADLTVTLEKDTYDYSGTAITPAAVVKDGDQILKEGTDYTVTYADNVYAGTASVIIAGKGIYSGTKTVTFRIKGKPAVINTDQDSYIKYVPTSKPFLLNAKTTSDATGFEYFSSNTDVVAVDASGLVTITGTGKATVTVKTVGSKAYDPVTKVVTVTVKPIKPVFSLSSPKKKQVKVLITKVEGATKYQIEYGRMGKYYKKTIKHIESEFTKTYTYINKRTSGRKYFIRVRAIKEMPDGTVVYGNWTTRKSIASK